MPFGISPIFVCIVFPEKTNFSLESLEGNDNSRTFAEKKTTMTTSVSVNISMPRADVAFIRQLGKRMGWEVKASAPSAPRRKIKMTESEFYAKLDHSIATSSEDTMSVMQPSETGQQFLNRMLGSN